MLPYTSGLYLLEYTVRLVCMRKPRDTKWEDAQHILKIMGHVLSARNV